MTAFKNLTSVKTIRFTGFLYLLVIICAGFSQGYVRQTLILADDAAVTAENILNNKGLFQLGFSTDLIAFLLDAVISILLYQIFKPFNKNLAMISSAFRLIAHPAIGSLNLLNHYMALKVLDSDSLLSSFTKAQVNDLSALFLEAHHYGYLIAGGFFGIHCLLFAVLIYKSHVFPKLFGGLLLGASAGYLVETFGNFNFPGYEGYTALIVGLAAAIGEIGLSLYMIFQGTRRDYKRNLHTAG